ncbi:MAG: exopolyphosphatase, partial [Clostridium sp.]
MKSIGIIDLGSNSLKLLIAEQRHSNNINVLFERKHQIRLSDYYIDDIPNLSAIGIYKLVLSIQNFNEKCKSFNCDKVIVVATETLRKCANKDIVLSEIKKETGLDVKILSGYEESYLGYISTINTLNYNNYFLVDMGGA